MGKLMLYGAGRVCQSLQTLNPVNSNYAAVHSYKDVNGTSYSYIVWSTGTGWVDNTLVSATPFRNLTARASADIIDDFSLEHNTTREIANLAYEQAQNTSSVGRVYIIKVTNNNAESVDVGSIKFFKTLPASPSGSGFSIVNCLICGYFLDNPVTLGAGEAKTFAVNFDFWNY